jgi:hypothetical protein
MPTAARIFTNRVPDFPLVRSRITPPSPTDAMIKNRLPIYSAGRNAKTQELIPRSMLKVERAK